MPLSFLPPQKKFRWRLVTAIFCIGIITIIGVSESWYARAWKTRILPGVAIGVVDVGGKTTEEARALLDQTIDTLMRAGLPFAYQSKRVTINPILSAREDPDLTYELVQWEANTMLEQALRVGHEGPWWQRWYEQSKAFLLGTRIPGAFTIKEEPLANALRENVSQFEDPAKNAELTITNGVVAITPEHIGKIFDYPKAIEDLRLALRELAVQPIGLTFVTDYPTVTRDTIDGLRPVIATLAERGPLQLIQGKRWWRIHPEEWGTWLTVALKDDKPSLTLDPKKVAPALAPIAEKVNTSSRDAKFVVKNGRVVEFQTAQKGQRLSVEKTIEKIRTEFFKGNTTSIAVVVDAENPLVLDQDVNTLGIVELIGVGTSNFKGSPANRRHNIATGAKALNGMLIPAGEEFSLLKALGDIDGEHGYRPELVIKGNKTIPEFGGGLCQIGTTTFRAALGSGLPITERQNHSYSVPYYLENGKPGIDATIYGPKPDFKFINDTGNTILMQTHSKGNDLIFEFWGKKDGRIAERAEPKVTNIRRPPPTKIIETEDLPPGKKKCTERAHTGATAEFTYTVTMPDGEKREKVFRSVYRPWQEVCLVGKAKIEAPSTEAIPDALPSADTEGVKGE